MRVFATFKGSYIDKNKKKDNIIHRWGDVCNDAGQSIGIEFISNKSNLTFELGSRYLMECESVENKSINEIKSIKQVFKNKRCDIMRNALGTFHFIKGKYKGLIFEDIDSHELSKYMLWLAKNTKNEATITNTLKVLEIIHKKTNNKLV